MSKPPEKDCFAGAMTLLRECIDAVPGQRLLLVSEPEGSNFYDGDTLKVTAAAARSVGLKVYTTETESFLHSATERAHLFDVLSGFDHVVFFSRVGDQIRFSSDSSMPSATMCYTLDLNSLASEFGTACYSGMCEIKDAIDRAFSAAEYIRVTCPKGTQFEGKPEFSPNKLKEVSLKRFPMLVSQPVPAFGFSGKIALSRFLVGTGSSLYEPYCLPLVRDVYACFENNSITHFEGDSEIVERVTAHYYEVSDHLEIEPWYVDSWHAGIHPGCRFSTPATDDIMRWSSTAFGNPRILHFHTCGSYAPGEISWNVVDPTIILDDIPLWEAGRLYPERLNEGGDIMDRHPKLAALFRNPYREIGISS